MLTPLGTGWAPLLQAVADALGFGLSVRSLEGLSRWLDLMVAWNARLDLTAARDERELVDLAVADAVVLAASAEPGSTWVDVGAGAGAPGLALALLRPDLRVTLAEPLQKRVAFLRNVVGATHSSHVRVERARGEALAEGLRRPGAPAAFRAAVSRAVLAPTEWVSLGTRLVDQAGEVWALLARDAPPAIPGWQATAERSYQWPLTQVSRRAVGYRRV